MSTTNPDRPPESKVECFTPRAYQVELLDKAIKKNIIVQLGTGAGKTFIAVLLIKEYALQLRSGLNENGKRAFFVVDKVALVDQQSDHIQCHTSLIVDRAHGSLNTQIWEDKAKFDAFMDANNVVVLTAQVLYDLIVSGYMKIHDIALLIFDECHHALGSNHPYRKIMDRYFEVEKDSRPRILGLTASLINDKTDPDTLEKKLSKLEKILDCSIETSCDIVNVTKYGAKPREVVMKCKNYRWGNAYSASALRVLDTVKEFCQTTQEFHPEFDLDVRKPINDAIMKTQSILKQLGPWAAWKITQIREKELRMMRKQAVLGDKQKDFIVLGETTMNTVRRLLEPKMRTINKLDQLLETLPNRIVTLLNILLTYNEKNQMERLGRVEPLCGIVFVEQRYVAYVLKLILKAVVRMDPRYSFLNVDYVIGNNSGSFEADTSQMLHKRLEDVLRKFRKGDLNLLIATNVLEEGVDVRHCNLVVKFDRPVNFRSYVQSKGRARKHGALYVIFVEEQDAEACAKSMHDFAKIEKLLLNRSRSVHNPPEHELTSVDDIQPPYIVESTGAKLFLSASIQLINRYCGKLPSDVFTRLVPQSKLILIEKNGQTLFQAELYLPMNSPLKEPIRLEENEAVPHKKLAQMLVAFKACKILHKMKELNDHLLPVGKESVLSLLDDDPDEFTPSYSARVGSMKRKQLYDKKTADVLREALPVKKQELYLYVLDIDLIHPLTAEENPKNRKIINPKMVDFCFGFLSAKEIPQVPSFPAYLRQGESRVNITLAPSRVTLDEQTLHYLKYFHHYIFRSILQLTKECLDFRMDETTPITTLIVPLDRIRRSDQTMDYSIKMEYVKEVVNNMEEMPRIPSDEKRKQFKFVASEWIDTVVMPWYRNVDQPQFFYVANILPDLNPSSSFPDGEFTTFNQYFQKKYELEIYDQEQSLLEVEFTSNRLNLLLPRMRTRHKPRPSRDTPSQQQILVPELLDRHPISAQLWHSIAALPSFFYRMNSLLLADEVRVRVLTEALGRSKEEATPSKEWIWKPLYYPTSYEEKSSMMVTKLDQLRREDNSVDRKRNSSMTDESTSQEKGFEIGVWDPALAIQFAPDSSALAKVPRWLDDTAGLHDTQITSGGDLSDDEDDHALFFDLSKSIKNTMKSTTEFAAPRDDIIEEIGWGDLPSADIEGDEPPLLIVGDASNEINVNGLMSDILGTLLPSQPIQPTVSSTPSVSTPQTKNIPKPLRQLWEGSLGASEDDDREKENPFAKKEETVDLILFDDLPDEEVDGDSKMDTTDEEREEIKNLEKGEEIKAERDHKAALSVQKEMKKGEVLASELIDARFSFHRPSETIVSKSTLNDKGILSGEKENAPYGVSPCLILTALTTSNASDGINLERLETIGDSFLKFTVTDFLFHNHPDLHEGMLSFARSKEVSNCNLYRLGKKIGVPSLIIGSKFDVQEGWLPPCYVPSVNFKAPNTEDAEMKDQIMERMLEGEEIPKEVRTRTGWDEEPEGGIKDASTNENGVETITLTKPAPDAMDELSPLPYNLLTQQYISDKCIADAVEALIGCHLLTLGPNPTLHMMKWLGLKVMTEKVEAAKPLIHYVDTPTNPHCAEEQLANFFAKFQLGRLEDKIGYRFNDKAYLLQAFTHASYYPNRITGCYQRLEFLGDAVLDYMITRFLFEHEKQYSPGVLTDLRSALVNNTIFASLAVKYDFHKHFVAMCPGLHFMIEKFVKLCKERNFFDANFHSEMYMVTTEDEIDEGQEEDVEVPKAMGDIFESVAGAIYLDCGRDLDVVWRVFYNLMKDTIEECCRNPPRSPVRELLEREHDKAKFSKLERIMETGKVRVTVEVAGDGTKTRFTGMGRNYRIAKTTAAKRALKYLKSLDQEKLRNVVRNRE